ncbi:hypothetical protein VNO78_19379 [Psophocarpus tetragonolobus]|uniref:Transcription repressor n=1 Tax=Psophocarpus tetragonolobus TaxID=3891 RepID=A0AAN9XGM1_PSOTE
MRKVWWKDIEVCLMKKKYPSERVLCEQAACTENKRREPDMASILASQRFFFSSPGTSNSIVDSPDSRSFVPTVKYSLNPYLDFLHSMHDMTRSRQLFDCDYLHQLLLCYLALNPPHTHKYIFRAFTDLLFL